MIDGLIEEIGDNYSEKENKESLVYTALIMIKKCNRKNQLDFCKNVFQWSLGDLKKEALGGLALDCMMIVDWKNCIAEITQSLEDDDDLGISHSVAVFVTYNGWSSLKKLKTHLNEKTVERINQLHDDIKDLVDNRYLPLKKKGY